MRVRYDAATRNRDLVIELAKQNISQTEIAKRVGTNRRFVRRLLLEEGIPLPIQQLDMEHNPHWKGGRMIDKQGYVLLRMPGHHLADSHGYVREHRLVAEQKIGRPLLPDEVPHHLDGDVANNAPENIVVYPSNAAHLAETLQGQVPKWTEDGRRRTLEGVRNRRAKKRRGATRPQSTKCDSQTP